MTTVKTYQPMHARKYASDSDERPPRRAVSESRSHELKSLRTESLVESEEYEWSSAMAMPGLIVAPYWDERVEALDRKHARRPEEQVIETEDGDARCFCQLPGRLIPVHAKAVGELPWMISPAVSNDLDEYSDPAAMQMPGRLVDCPSSGPASVAETEVRGLCATCVHHHDCDFPRPAGGVWRCEEYA